MLNSSFDFRKALQASFLAGLIALDHVLACSHGQAPPQPTTARTASWREADLASGQNQDQQRYVAWLKQRSMLAQADMQARRYAGTKKLWQQPFAEIRPRAASSLAPVWFTAYPAAVITGADGSVLEALGDERLWEVFDKIGIRAMHTGPMKRSGGVIKYDYTPTVDGNFDRIGFDIDPAFGTEAQYRRMVTNAKRYSGTIIGDVIPGHTGKGPDYRLAILRYGDYPGLYHIVEIDPRDWNLLPNVPLGQDSVTIPPKAVQQLKQRGYIVGELYRVIFYEPGIKESNWSATATIEGVDGKKRRWVYLHYFKAGQPALNWLDPTFAAQRLIVGDVIHALNELGIGMLRLDANGFLGIEPGEAGKPAWSEGHPLSLTANQLIAGMARKLGGFTFQELNLAVEDIAKMQQGGADLSYDFITRPAYHHALVTGDAEFLRLMLGLMHQYEIDPAMLIHALQNHDELTLELVHFWDKHKDDIFFFRGKKRKGLQVRDIIRKETHELLLRGDSYNLKAFNGVSSTTTSVIAAGLNIADIRKLTDEQKQQIKQAHLLLVLYNAFQPGVFALSGWDLVGTLPLPKQKVQHLMADGDTRWINRGAYDLLGNNFSAKQSAAGLPRADTLYGSLPEQLKDPQSFASKLKHMLAVRQQYRIYESRQLPLPDVKSPGLVVMVHQLPDDLGYEVTAINFGRKPLREQVTIAELKGKASVSDLLSPESKAPRLSGARLALNLQPLEGKALLIK